MRKGGRPINYFKVKPEYDNRRKHRFINDFDIYIANELYTEKEITKQKLNRDFMEQVSVSRKKTYWFFGARFSYI